MNYFYVYKLIYVHFDNLIAAALNGNWQFEERRGKKERRHEKILKHNFPLAHTKYVKC